MHELHRQMYLSALGIDTYMPRWHLPFASASTACSLPLPTQTLTREGIFFNLESENLAPKISLRVAADQTDNTILPINTLIDDLLQTNKVEKPKLVDTDKPALPNLKLMPDVAATVEAFSLSIWRPNKNLIVIDSRNTKLALPTELLLRNILQHVFPQEVLEMKDEVLRCPMIENSFVKSTLNDIRTELQTWLSVQCEFRPVKYLWLMGSNAATYLLPQKLEKSNDLWQSVLLNDLSIKALVLPSINELLQRPSQKKQLFSALKHYHS